MGKSSSAKKVARAARAGGATSQGKKRNLLFPVSIAAIVLLGVSVVWLAKGQNADAAKVAPQVTDHFHAAYGIYVCDKFLDPLTDPGGDTLGIHTHGDGIIHIHPFGGAAAGKNATMSTWGKTDGLEFSKTGFTVNGTTYDDGYDCNGQPATVKMYVWNADDTSAAPQIVNASDIGGFRFKTDRLALTLAVVPEGADVPPPTSIPTLDNLSDVAGATTTTSLVGSATVTPGATTEPATTDTSAPATTVPAP
ncbi:MAG: hypothetical protein F2837_10345 [Actinobacteria bacterium]|uniref:Unannotated protein n=1 Tax=freshwater metagenome TaxID=449393 RepID=A0A6J7KLI8_9ZZZZ|nr:hypothetical protein [Actinomycetota bacterium]